MSSLNGPHGEALSAAAELAAQSLRAPLDPSFKEHWAQKTSAQLVSEQEFMALKHSAGLHVVGITGFSGQWSQERIEADQEIQADTIAARAAIAEYLAQLKSVYADKLVLSSGATMEGVPKIIYELCEKLGIAAMGVTSAKAIDYQLGKMDYLIVQGSDWGEESATFLATSDELLMVGGGGQAKREAIAASTEGKAVTILQGFKGTADQLTQDDVPNARFIMRH